MENTKNDNYHYKSGFRLTNGALVLLGKQGVCLAMFKGQFVTWATNPEGETFWGHYFGENLKEALQDFEERR